MNRGAWAPRILSIFRILAGVMFACHGSQKVLGWYGGIPPEAKGWMVSTAGPIELFGGILIALGLFTRPAAFIMSGEMAFAYFISHAPRGFFPILNGGDGAILYCFIFLYFAFAGPGPWSLDAMWRKKA